MDPARLHRKTFGNPRLLAGIVLGLFVYALAALFIPLCVNHEALITADPYSYVSFARNLAEGHYFLHGDVADAIAAFHENDALAQGPIWNTNVRPDGSSLYTIAIGYPLFLAVMLKAGGMWLVVHINLLLQLAVLLVLAWCVWEGMDRSLFGLMAGTAAALILVHSHPGTFLQLSYPWREPLFYLCLLVGMTGLLRFRRNGRLADVAVAGVALGFAVAVKEANAIYVLWLGALLAASPAFRRHPRRVRVLAVFVAAGVIGGSQLLVQNALATGNPLLSMQFQRETAHFVEGGQGLAPVHAATTLSRYWVIYQALPWFHWPWLLVVAGMAAGVRRYPVVRMAAGILVLHLLLYLQWGNADLRHMYFAHVPYAILAAVGAGAVIRAAAARGRGLQPYRDWLVLLPMAALALWPSPWRTVEDRETLFRVQEAERLTARVLGAADGERPILFSNRTLRDVLGIYGDTTVVRWGEVHPIHPGGDPYPVVAYWMERGRDLWFLDNPDLDPKHAGRRRTDGDAESLRWQYNLVPEAVLAEEGDRLRRFLGAGQDALTLHRIEPWTDTEITRVLDPPGPEGAAYLYLQPRAVGDAMDVRVNGVPPEGAPGSYPYLPVHAINTATGAVLTAHAGGRPIPNLQDARLIDWAEPLRMPCGVDASPPDTSLFPTGLANQPNLSFRQFEPAMDLRVPVRSGPDWFTTIGLGLNMTGTATGGRVFVQSPGSAREEITVAANSAWFPVLVDTPGRWAGTVDVHLTAEPALTFKLNQVKSFASFRRLAHEPGPDACGVGISGFLTPMARGAGPHPWRSTVNGVPADQGACRDNPGLRANGFDRLLTRGAVEDQYLLALEQAGVIKPEWIDFGPRLDIDMGSVAAAVLTDAFFDRELHQGRPFRWTQATSVLWVPVVPDSAHYRVALEVEDGHPSGGRTFTLTLPGGDPVSLPLPESRTTVSTQLALPTAPAARGMTPLTITSETWQPGAILDTSNDPRTLGFQVYHVRWEPEDRSGQ
jgi:hypothetical protein